MLLALVVALGSVAGILLLRRFPTADRFTRFAAAVLPTLALWFAAQSLAAIAISTAFVWNGVRLARSVALWRGFKLYYGPWEDGPILGTMHVPLTQLLYAPLSLMGDPTIALVAGSICSCVLVLGAIGWLLAPPQRRDPAAWLKSALVFLAAGFVIVQTPGLRYCAFNVHTDAGALAFATLAAGVLYKAAPLPSWKPLGASALFAMLAVWSKQTMAPMVLALVLFVWLAGGFRWMLRYALCLAAAGAIVSGLILAIFWPPGGMWFNIFTLARNRPPRPNPLGALLMSYSALKNDAMFAVIPVLFLAAHAWTRGHLRKIVATECWPLFLLIALCLAPVSIAAQLTAGADVNHLGLVSYFVLLAAATALAVQPASDPFRARASAILTVVLIAVNLDPVAVMELPYFARHVRFNPAERAYEFSRAHPGLAYFPWNPLAALLAEGTAYHFDYALYDREVRSYPVSREQFESSIPATFRYIAFPPEKGPTSTPIRHLIASLPQVKLPGLEGWTVYARSNLIH